MMGLEVGSPYLSTKDSCDELLQMMAQAIVDSGLQND